MHAVVNHLPIKPDSDWSALTAKVDAFNAMVDHPDFRGLSMIRAGDDAAIFLVLFASRVALDDISHNVAAPWFAESVRPFLAGPVSRSVGEIVAGTLSSET
jgi:hypothetical protein